MATTCFESFLPTRCWIAPEMPTAIHSSGAMTLTVWPTCNVLSAYPASPPRHETHPLPRPARLQVGQVSFRMSLRSSTPYLRTRSTTPHPNPVCRIWSAISTGSTGLSSTAESWAAAGRKGVPWTAKSLMGMPAGVRTVAMRCLRRWDGRMRYFPRRHHAQAT